MVMPITSPQRLSSGPPEFPGLMAASVWRSDTGRPAGGFGEELIQARYHPMGQRLVQAEGIADHHDVFSHRVVSESPRASIGNCGAGDGSCKRKTARSRMGSAPRTVAGAVRPSSSVTVMPPMSKDHMGIGQDQALHTDDETRARDRVQAVSAFQAINHNRRDGDNGGRHALEQLWESFGTRRCSHGAGW